MTARPKLTLLGPQSRFGGKLLIIRVNCPHIWECGAKGVNEVLCRKQQLYTAFAWRLVWNTITNYLVLFILPSDNVQHDIQHTINKRQAAETSKRSNAWFALNISSRMSNPIQANKKTCFCFLSVTTIVAGTQKKGKQNRSFSVGRRRSPGPIVPHVIMTRPCSKAKPLQYVRSIRRVIGGMFPRKFQSHLPTILSS